MRKRRQKIEFIKANTAREKKNIYRIEKETLSGAIVNSQGPFVDFYLSFRYICPKKERNAKMIVLNLANVTNRSHRQNCKTQLNA